MYCSNCGKEIDDKADVCVNCGHAAAPKLDNYEAKKTLVVLVRTCCCVNFVLLDAHNSDCFIGLDGFKVEIG